MVSQNVRVLEFNSLKGVISLGEEEGGKSRDDSDGNDLDDDNMDTDVNMDDEDHIPLPDDHVLDFVITTLPFYLSKADYKRELAIHTRSLLIGQNQDKLHSKPLHEAIDLYLKVSLYFYLFVLIDIYWSHRRDSWGVLSPASTTIGSCNSLNKGISLQTATRIPKSLTSLHQPAWISGF